MFGLAKPYFSSQNILAPLSGQVGALLPILRAILVTGAGAASVQTLTVSAGVATATFAAAHSYIVCSVVLLAGADQAAINGEARVLSVPTPNSITFATAAADGAATGSITCRLAPAGWEEVFTGADVAVFRPTAIGSTSMFMRVGDTAAQNASIRCYEDMTDVDTGTNPIPTVAQIADGLLWPKSHVTSSAARPFAIFADAAGIYFCPCHVDNAQHAPYYAGKIKSWKAGDAWDWLITGKRTTGVTSESEGNLSWSTKTDKSGIYAARGVAGGLGPVSLMCRGESANGNTDAYSAGSAYANLTAYPNPANDGLLISRVELHEAGGVRGTLPGLYHIRQSAVAAFSTGQVVDVSGDLGTRKMVALKSGHPYSTTASAQGLVLFDVTDTWGR